MALKTLKVAELRDILVNAGVSFPHRANKADLIAKITASPAALNAFNNLHSSSRVSQPKPAPKATAAPQNDDLLAPPEDVDWNTDNIDESPVTSVSPAKQVQKATENPSKPASKQPPVAVAHPTSTSTKPAATAKTASSSAAATTTAASPSTAAPSTVNNTAQPVAQPSTKPLSAEDLELEKRKRRAERFGIPLVTESDPKQARQSRKALAVPNDDVEKLAARAARFGINHPESTTAKKRTSPAAEIVDKEELDKRAKRAKRFGVAAK